MKKINLIFIKRLIIGFILIIILSGCATHYIDATASDPYGFFYGIWHGVCLPFALAGKFLSWILGFFDIYILKDLKFAGKPNTGNSYVVGYIIGLFIILSAK